MRRLDGDPPGEVMDIVEAFRIQFPSLPLLQGNELSAAQKIQDPESLDDEQLQALYLMGYSLMEAFPSMFMVAYTEFPPEVFDFFGADPSLNHAIYISQTRNLTTAGSLLINPFVQTDPKTRRLPHLEGCGSINYTKISMFALRPITNNVSAYVIDLHKNLFRPVYTNYRGNSYRAAAGLHHEYDHLLGFDATNSPNTTILDPWSLSREEYSQEIEDQLAYGVEKLLVRRNNKLIVVNAKGKYVRDFIREDYTR